MARILFGIIAVIASVMLVDSLTCNSCSFGLLGTCYFFSDEVSCTQNSTEVCFTATATFPSISSSFSGFRTMGCRGTSGCNATTNATLLTITYDTQIDCCSTDKCNSGAPTTKLSLTATLGAAVLASVWGTMIY